MNKITYEERKRIYAAALAKWGAGKQTTKAIEELGEAIVAICKNALGCDDRNHLAEEIADATIMLEQLRQIYNINASVSDWMDRKCAALQRRIKEED